jgi:multisubunit Na+/H+ antiporter MnhG subunit
MSLDLRIPLGLLFLIVGVLLSIYGLVTRGSEIYLRSAGMDINLIWGVVMLVFGLAMFLLGRYSDSHAEPEKGTPNGSSRTPGHGH